MKVDVNDSLNGEIGKGKTKNVMFIMEIFFQADSLYEVFLFLTSSSTPHTLSFQTQLRIPTPDIIAGLTSGLKLKRTSQR